MTDIQFPWRKQATGRIFISYRREDTQWVSGRLADSLSRYFGDERVFRDIEDISGGADFSEVIDKSVDSADAAVVLIGPNWLSAVDSAGNQRISKPDDWVAREINTALNSGVPIFPVLVEDTAMPDVASLPESLQRLGRYNAVKINDNRWEDDVAKLAKIVSLDIPSVTERKLITTNLLVSVSLALSIIVTTGLVVFSLLSQLHEIHGGVDTSPGWLTSWLGSPRDAKALPVTWPLTLAESGMSYIIISLCSLALFLSTPHVDPARRNYFIAAACSGVVGSLLFFILLAPVEDPYEPVIMYLGSTVTAAVMFALMNLSGFKAR